jgi:CPA1 family monovalent cation:H+ antiporter
LNFDFVSSLLATAGIASYLNHRWLRLPPSIGLTVIALAVSAALAAMNAAGMLQGVLVQNALKDVDFSGLLLHGLLGYLLFAGALHVDITRLFREAWPIALLATVGVGITTAVVGVLFWLACQSLGVQLPLLHALLFGALIAPTDPVAVLGIMDKVGAPASLRMRVTGESLFNDGIGVVVFLALAGYVTLGPQESPGWTELVTSFLREVGGGLALGCAGGYLVYRMLATVNAYRVEVLLTVGLAGGIYSLAEALSVSAPIAAVVAGLIIGGHGRAHAMSEETRGSLDTFWKIVEDALNAVLFLLIGLEVLILHLDHLTLQDMVLAFASIAIVLASRLIGVAVPLELLGKLTGVERGSLGLLTWSGLRGGISIALALSLPSIGQAYLILLCTYAVVVFSVLVQGLTLAPLIKRSSRPR